MLRARLVCTLLVLAAASTNGSAHSGPPFPIVSDHRAGPYLISIWTDPDTTDDGTAGGQFWVKLRGANGEALPPQTRVTVAIAPSDGSAAELKATAAPVRGDPANQFAALVMEREGRFEVRVIVEGPLGNAAANATVDATYDLRPPAPLMVLYLMPFVLVGLLWLRLLRKRRSATAGS